MKEYLTTHKIKVIKDLPYAPKGTLLKMDKDGWFSITFGACEKCGAGGWGGLHAHSANLRDYVEVVEIKE